MSDGYVNFANTKVGTKLTQWLGLPQPMKLVRQVDRPQEDVGRVLIGGASNSSIADLTQVMLKELSSDNELMIDVSSDNDCDLEVLIFDARHLRTADQSCELHDFFKRWIRRIKPCGRILILGKPPEREKSLESSVVQRALEGFMRSLAKEARKGITAQLLYIDDGADQAALSTLAFFMSSASAYVSGQVVRISNASEVLSSSIKPVQQRVLVTGCAQGIGRAVAKRLAESGFRVTCLDIPAASESLLALAAQINGDSLLVDLNSSHAVQKVVDFAREQGAWDAVIHNAGITRDKTLAKMTSKAWSDVVNINLGVQLKINAALLETGGLSENARIIGVSSISGIAGNRGQTNYAFSKAGVLGMVESMSSQFNDTSISVNAVAPGFIETEMTAAMPFTIREAGRRLNSLGQGGLPIDVAETIAWLAHPSSSGVRGNVIRVCGQNLLGA